MAELMRVLNAALAESHGRYRQLRHLVPLSGRYQAGLVRSLPTIPANNLFRCNNRRCAFCAAVVTAQKASPTWSPPSRVLGRYQIAIMLRLSLAQ